MMIAFYPITRVCRINAILTFSLIFTEKVFLLKAIEDDFHGIRSG